MIFAASKGVRGFFALAATVMAKLGTAIATSKTASADVFMVVLLPEPICGRRRSALREPTHDACQAALPRNDREAGRNTRHGARDPRHLLRGRSCTEGQ